MYVGHINAEITSDTVPDPLIARLINCNTHTTLLTAASSLPSSSNWGYHQAYKVWSQGYPPSYGHVLSQFRLMPGDI